MSFLVFFYVLLGLAVGSFLNVCIYRIPRRESVVFPPSHCTHCGAPVRPYDNVPILSYVWLGARCRSCKSPISPRYPLVELLTGSAFYVCALEWGFAPPTFVNTLFLCFIIALVFIDYDHQILPNVLTLPGLFLGIVLSPLQSETLFRDAITFKIASFLPENLQAVPWTGSILGAVVGSGLLLLTRSLYMIVRKREGLGMGDVKMMAMVGAFLGWRLALLTVFAGSVLGSIAGIALVLFRGGNFQARLAFGTFLGSGAVLSLFYGLSFVRWYAGGP